MLDAKDAAVVGLCLVFTIGLSTLAMTNIIDHAMDQLPKAVPKATVQKSVELQAPEGYMPEVVLVRRTLADDARVCVERADGGVDCRMVRELRKWVMDRPAAKR